MSETAHSKKEGSHDDCEDCKREKKQNQAFIAIYQKLQNIQKKSILMKVAVGKHKAISETNRSFYKSIQKKIVSLPKVRDRSDTHTMQKVGFEIAAGLIQKQARNKVYAQNLRLKELISSMQKDRMRQSRPTQQQNLMVSSNNPMNTLTTNAKMNQSFNSTLSSNLPNNTDGQIENLQKLMASQDSSYTQNQNTITQSTSFKSTNLKKPMDFSRYGDMNLWLYEHQKHAKLQEDLYLTKSVKNGPATRKSAAAAYLPTIRIQK